MNDDIKDIELTDEEIEDTCNLNDYDEEPTELNFDHYNNYK